MTRCFFVNVRVHRLGKIRSGEAEPSRKEGRKEEEEVRKKNLEKRSDRDFVPREHGMGD